MRKYVIGSIEAIATVIAILTIAGIINSAVGLVGKSQIFGTISLSAIGITLNIFLKPLGIMYLMGKTNNQNHKIPDNFHTTIFSNILYLWIG